MKFSEALRLLALDYLSRRRDHTLDIFFWRACLQTARLHRETARMSRAAQRDLISHIIDEHARRNREPTHFREFCEALLGELQTEVPLEMSPGLNKIAARTRSAV